MRHPVNAQIYQGMQVNHLFKCKVSKHITMKGHYMTHWPYDCFEHDYPLHLTDEMKLCWAEQNLCWVLVGQPKGTIQTRLR